MNWMRWLLVVMCAAVSVLCPCVPSLGGGTAYARVHRDHLENWIDHRASTPDDHSAALAQLDASRASHVAARSGDWSDPDTWSPGVPTASARVVIPQDVTVTVKAPIAVAIDWVRVEGRLHFSPTDDSQLVVTTVFVTPAGTLSVGTADTTVDSGKTVQLLFPPRSAEIRRQDRFDILGGLIALGHVYLHGAPKAGFATPSNPLHRGVSALTFLTLPTGWKVGDTLLFPAADSASKDEQHRIASISDDGRTMTLSSPLTFRHVPPYGVRAEVPVGNLTRNVILASTETGTLHQRAHVMVMAHEPVHISGTAFRGLGRTTAVRPHTLPTVNDDGEVSAGANPVGRYAVHFHLVSGASRRLPPHIFTGNVIVDSPKHGLVNHGGYVVAENNVTFAIHGSHFFAENGSEIGAFRHNLAVFSRGSGEHIEGRQPGIGDFGHGGHGFWSQSPALVMEGNYAFHHAGPAYVIFAAPIEAAEGTQKVFFRGTDRIANFLRDNLDSPLRDMVTETQIPPTTIPFRFSVNVAAHSGRGLEVWHTNSVSNHDLQSIVEDCVFWKMRSAGIAITYGVNTVVRNSILLGSDPVGCSEFACEGSVGITTDGGTRNLIIEHVHVARFSTGMRVPSRGTTQISKSSFDNKYNILLYPAQQPGRQTIVAGNTFARHRTGGEDYHFLEGGLFHGDVSMLFERDPLIVDDQRFPGKTIYRVNQYPAAIPFRHSGIPQLDGKTASEIRRAYGLAIGGVLAPRDATAMPGVGGLVGKPVNRPAEMADEETMLARMNTGLQTGSGKESYASNHDQGYGSDCCNIHRIVKGLGGERTGWRFLTTRDRDKTITKLVYVDTSPPRFALDPRIKLEIHPDDVKYGFLIQGTLYDEGAAPEIVRRAYNQLKVADGYVKIPFEYPDRAGNVFRQDYRLKVTPRAAKRGSNLFHDIQRASGEKRD
jgi:G8 domain